MQGFSLIDRQADGTEAILKERQKRVNLFFDTNRARAGTYVASAELKTAADVALTLGRPLLLTGEPGSGKTLAAFWLASRLGLLSEDHFHEYQVRSDSRARDICYDFDAVSWFRKSQIEQDDVVDKSAFISPRALGIAFGWNGAEDANPHVVLIDEIDKAPRDFPNDLLLELDQMKFTIAETGRTIGPPRQRPIIVITSNSERRLPDPFLRRCITHNIEIKPETVLEILTARLKAYRSGAQVGPQDDQLVAAGGAFWSGLSELEGRFTRKPTVAEFWQWLILASEYPDNPDVNLIEVLKKKRGPEIAKLPRIGSLFLPADLAVVSNG
ncbi:MoxR family ATPase [Mesorhizobium sp. CA8]|uniref:AAA family ATPase n=1 Tax=Mesorhizobium sp. CA8 TaxID=2876637 RepID=UPI001CC9C756|nr:MoxR family ATPase [Mesorhizobium sp. CA8]MBZ9763373.1 MoxR family ATPase [Mesorhizobium sp. CA8]